MRKLLNTLFITSEKALLSLNGETVCVEIDKQKVGQFPMHTLESIICFLIMERPLRLWELVRKEILICHFSHHMESSCVE